MDPELIRNYMLIKFVGNKGRMSPSPVIYDTTTSFTMNYGLNDTKHAVRKTVIKHSSDDRF